ncbi:PTS sugar transporter subunit IIB [Caldifermentibacillus hisashii]|uniref:hypothetical protein n=1 Tax=Caldifermentibacillus hisashii TaxID=996558 RepID=UPI001F244379|nr:hypothetical protein [Caldifermentibacillus hisashii]
MKNELTQEEIDEADVVILAVSITIEGLERFEGKKIYYADVNECISNTTEVIDKAIEFSRGK